MPRSLARGDYSLLMAIESSSRVDSWYRVLADRQTGQLSCDCPRWLFRQGEQTADEVRSCPHTQLAERLLTSGSPPPPAQSPAPGGRNGSFEPAPFLNAVQTQWPGLSGQFALQDRRGEMSQKPYHFFLLQLESGNGTQASGVVAFASAHNSSEQYYRSRVAAWAGYALAAEVARRGGFPLAGQPPEHFRPPARTSRAPRAGRAASPSSVIVPAIGLADILRVGDQVDLGDGLRPVQRAENTLRLFLGPTLYQQLETHHFLDVSSVHFADRQRVYRLRRDPDKRYERRVRVFEQGRYVKDFCIIKGAGMDGVPEADHFLTVFLGLLSDEMKTISVVGQYNIFDPRSDGREQETIPAVWHPCVA